MNETCLKCGAKCCKVAYFQCSGEHQRFILATRPASPVRDGVLVKCQCHQLGDDNKCTIYQSRPAICRDWLVGGEGCRMVREALGDKV